MGTFKASAAATLQVALLAAPSHERVWLSSSNAGSTAVAGQLFGWSATPAAIPAFTSLGQLAGTAWQVPSAINVRVESLQLAPEVRSSTEICPCVHGFAEG